MTRTKVVLKCFTKVANAGDAFSAGLAAALFGVRPELVGPDRQERENLLLVGSILQWADRHSVVCGAGFISGKVRFELPPQRILMVRGPHTGRALGQLGVPDPRRYADPGVLAPRLFPRVPALAGRVGLVPHYVDMDVRWVQDCRDKGVRIIDPALPLADYFDALQGCEVILSSSLHGLVFAHAFDRPALWIELGDRVHGDGFKFRDYYASLGAGEDKIRRVAVKPGDDPLALAVLATCPSTRGLMANAEEAMHELVESWPGPLSQGGSSTI